MVSQSERSHPPLSRSGEGCRPLPNDTVIDGEIVAFDENSRLSFNLLQGFGEAQAIVLYAFDLLMRQGCEGLANG